MFSKYSNALLLVLYITLLLCPNLEFLVPNMLWDWTIIPLQKRWNCNCAPYIFICYLQVKTGDIRFLASTSFLLVKKNWSTEIRLHAFKMLQVHVENKIFWLYCWCNSYNMIGNDIFSEMLCYKNHLWGAIDQVIWLPSAWI